MKPKPSIDSAGLPDSPVSDWRTQAAILFALLTAVLVLNSLRADEALMLASAADWLAFKGDELLRQVPRVAVAVVALQAVQRLPTAHPLRTPAALLALLAAAFAGSAAAAFALPYEPLAVRVGASASTEIWFWFVLWNNIMVNLLVLIAIDGLRRRHQATQRLAAAQEQARIVRQQLAHSQLLAIQARVDPQLLFDTLAAVRRLYGSDGDRAERLLDELTAFLRAALPRLRSARSTLEIEFGLAQAYVRLLQGAGATPIELQVRLASAHAPLAFPAGVLLPLLSGRSQSRRAITLQASADGARLHVSVHDSVAPSVATLERLRASLDGLYGAPARLRCEPNGDGASTDLELPFEAA